jgi:hypothetical protein
VAEDVIGDPACPQELLALSVLELIPENRYFGGNGDFS